MARDLSTKGLARRLDAQYAAVRPFRKRLFIATASCVIIAAVAVAFLWVAGKPNQRQDLMYQPGTVHGVHQASVATCTQCHVPGESAPERKCKDCHDSPEHHEAKQSVLAKSGLPKPPACAECHLEHRGGTRAEPPKDARCVGCHQRLSTSPGADEPIANEITSFDTKHPEFDIVEKKGADAAKLKFNHKFHLDPTYRKEKVGVVSDGWGGLVKRFLADAGISRAGSTVATGEMACTDCHRPDSSGKLMIPVSFEKHCRSCHNLDVDLETRGDQPSKIKRVPHVEPADIHKYLVAEFTSEHHAQLEATANNTATADLSHRYPKTAARYQTQWVRSRVDNVEGALASSGRCLQCHIADTTKTKEGTTSLERLALLKTNIPHSWYKRAKFNHFSHRALKCDSCHGDARTSSDTSDVNLPGLKDCRGCHSTQGGARADCSECHLYHDPLIRARDEGKIEKLPGSDKQADK